MGDERKTNVSRRVCPPLISCCLRNNVRANQLQVYHTVEDCASKKLRLNMRFVPNPCEQGGLELLDLRHPIYIYRPQHRTEIGSILETAAQQITKYVCTLSRTRRKVQAIERKMLTNTKNGMEKKKHNRIEMKQIKPTVLPFTHYEHLPFTLSHYSFTLTKITSLITT